MDGREFLESAREALAIPCERNWRTATGRAYYALLHEGDVALAAWGISRPQHEHIHQFVQRRFAFTPHPDLQLIGRELEWLARHRNKADYRLTTSADFSTSRVAVDAVQKATDMVALIDAITADATRRAAVAAALKAAWP